MDWQTWFSINWQQVVGIALSVIGFYFCLILFTRIVGLRSFSKLSSYDLAMTVGIGSILASTVLSKSTSMMCLLMFSLKWSCTLFVKLD